MRLGGVARGSSGKIWTIIKGLEAKLRSSFFTLRASGKQYGKVLSRRVIWLDLHCGNPGCIEERGLEECETGGSQLRSCCSDLSKRWQWLKLWLGQWGWREMNRLQWSAEEKIWQLTNTENGGKYQLLKSGIKEGYHHRTYGHWRENKKHNFMLINLTLMKWANSLGDTNY